jgi:serine/threonine protein kinase
MTDTVVQVGGKLLGQGTYGCVFTPPLLCKGQRQLFGPQKGRLGKISKKEDVKNEIEAAVYLSKVPNNERYFLLPDHKTLCDPSAMSVQKEKDIAKCDVLAKEGEHGMVHFQMSFGGEQLRILMQKPDFKLKDFPFFRFFGQCLEFGAILALNGYVHFDIHSANILLTKEFRPRLIDFGRAFPANSISQGVVDERWTQYDASYPQESPEMTMIIGAYSGMSIDRCLRDIRAEKPTLGDIERVLGISKSQQIYELSRFWRTSRTVVKEDWVGFWKLYWPFFDAWSIGNYLISVLRKMLYLKEFVDGKEWIQKEKIVEDVLKGLLRLSPRERIDCVQALSMYDPANPIVQSKAAKAWLEGRRATIATTAAAAAKRG